MTNNKYIKATKKVNYKMKDDNDDIDYGKSSVCQLFQMMADKRTKKLKGFARTDKYCIPKNKVKERWYNEETKKHQTVISWEIDRTEQKIIQKKVQKEMDRIVKKSSYVRYGNEIGAGIKGRLSKDDWK